MSHIEWGLVGIFIVLLMIYDQLRRLNKDDRDDDYIPEPPSAPRTPAQVERDRKIRLMTDVVRRFNEEEREREIQQGVAKMRRSKEVENPSDAPSSNSTEPQITSRIVPPDEAARLRADPSVKFIDLSNLPEPDFSTGTTVFALLCNKSAIGIYTSYEKAEGACEMYKTGASGGFESVLATHLYQIKPFKLDGPAMAYLPY